MHLNPLFLELVMKIGPISTFGIAMALLFGCSSSDAATHGSNLDAGSPAGDATSGSGGGTATGGTTGTSGGSGGGRTGATGGVGAGTGGGGTGGSGGVAGSGGGSGGGLGIIVIGSDAGPQACQGHRLTPDPPLVACSLNLAPSIPDGGSLDGNQVNVWYSTGSGPATEVPRIIVPSECSLNQNDGWYYDNPVSPTQIILCSGTCSHGPTATFSVLVGCATIIGTH